MAGTTWGAPIALGEVCVGFTEKYSGASAKTLLLDRGVWLLWGPIAFGAVRKILACHGIPPLRAQHASIDHCSYVPVDSQKHMVVVQYSFISNWGLAPRLRGACAELARSLRGACARTVWLTMAFG